MGGRSRGILFTVSARSGEISLLSPSQAKNGQTRRLRMAGSAAFTRSLTPYGQYQPASNHDIFAAMTISHNQPVMFTAKRYARLKWACRRGMLELDVLLQPFVEEAFNDLSEQDKETFERLLTCDDPDLFAWFMGHQACNDPELARMVDTIVSRVKV